MNASNRNVKHRKRWSSTLQLIRLPNLFTVPGDTLAGFLLASLAGGISHSGAQTVAKVIGVAMALYVVGLIGNDLCDYAEDTRERPGRPLPSGAISRRSAVMALWLLTGVALGLAFWAGGKVWLATLLLLALIGLYNGYAKRHPLGGPLVMGACRGGSMGLGVVAASSGSWPTPSPLWILGMTGLIAYVAAVSALARHETRQTRLGRRREAPWALWGIAVLVLSRFAEHSVVSLALMALSVLWPWWLARKLGGTPKPECVQRTVGALIRGLLPLQATLAALAGGDAGTACAFALLALWPLSALTARKWKGS